MKIFVLLLAVAAFAGFVYPRTHEQTQTNCEAMEKRVRLLLQDRMHAADPRTAQALATRVPVGDIVAGFLHEHLPFLPPEPACAAAYWLTVLRPGLELPALKRDD